jgi:hypothetical protein
MLALAAVADLGVDRRDDPIGPCSTMKARNAVIVAVEVLADQLAQQPMRRGDGVIVAQPVAELDGSQRPLGVLGDAREHPLTRRLLAPAAVRLFVRARIVERQRPLELPHSVAIDGGDRVKQLAHTMTNQPHGVLRRRRAEHRRRVDDLLDRAVQQPQLLGQLQRALQRQPLQAVQQKPGAELRQRRRMPALMIDRQPQRDLPPQIPRHALHRLLIRHAAAVLQQQHLRQLRRRDRRAPHRRRVARREVLIAHDPIPMLGQQRKKRPVRQRPSKLGRIEKPHLARRHRKHHDRVLNPPDGTATISAVF